VSGNDDEPMTPEARRRLVEAPFTISVVGRSRAWGGTGVSNWFKNGKERAYTFTEGGGQWPKYRSRSVENAD
jgi:hypothetical protein